VKSLYKQPAGTGTRVAYNARFLIERDICSGPLRD